MKPGTRAHRPQGVAPAIDIMIASPLWKAQRGVRALLQRAICEAAAMAATNGGELAIVLTDDSAIRTLNRDWRGKDQPTNVLSFPARAPSVSLPGERGRVGCGLASAAWRSTASQSIDAPRASPTRCSQAISPS